MAENMQALLAVIRRQAAEQPPVHCWQPTHRQPLPVLIDGEGRWFHEGEAFQRPALVRLLASVLHHDAQGYALLTPTLRWDIQVEDVPFIAGLDSVQQPGPEQTVFLRTTVGDLLPLDIEHPLEMRAWKGQVVPYVRVRADLWARLSRSAYYQLADVLQEQAGRWGLFSAGRFWPWDIDLP